VTLIRLPGDAQLESKPGQLREVTREEASDGISFQECRKRSERTISITLLAESSSRSLTITWSYLSGLGIWDYVMSMVPGLYPDQKLWMLSAAGGLLALSLGIGVWKFRSSEVPFMAWPLGPIVGVVLLLELAECVAGAFQVFYTVSHIVH
jgi:hypothetical protein